MQTIGYLLLVPYAVALIVSGDKGWPVWTAAIWALLGFLIAHLIQPSIVKSYAQSWYGGYWQGIPQVAIASYLIQAILALILFGVGYAARLIF